MCVTANVQLKSLATLGIEGYAILLNVQNSDCHVLSGSNTSQGYVEAEEEKGHSLDNMFFKYMCDFSELQLSASFAVLSDDSFIMTVRWKEGLSSAGVPVRMYGYSAAGIECSPNNTVGSSESSVIFPIPGAEPGNTFNYSVLFQNNECIAVHNGSLSITAFTHEATIAVSAIVSCIVGLIIGILIAIIIMVVHNKCRRGASQSSPQPHIEMTSVGPIYEEPAAVDFKSGPKTDKNMAYRHAQPVQFRH